MAEVKWPIRPDHITNDGLSYKENTDAAKRELSRLTGVGIIPNDYLQGLHTVIASALGNPTTIIEFPVDPKEPPVRTDSIAIHFDLHPPCRIFRSITEGTFCKRCDSVFASLFRGLMRQNVTAEITRAIKDPARRNGLVPRPGAVCAFHDDDPDRPYLEYDCPLLGYRELIFPIFFEDRIIAVFFLGEIVLRDRLEFIEKAQADFFASHPNCDCHAKVKDAHAGWIADASNVYGAEKYAEQLQLAKFLLNNLDSQLQKEVALQRDWFLQSKVGDYAREFRECLNVNILAISSDLDACWRRENVLEPLWSALASVFQRAVNELALRFIAVFGSNTSTDNSDGLLAAVVTVGRLPDVRLEDEGPLSFDLDRLPEDIRKRAATSKDHPELFSGLLNCNVDRESLFLRLVPGTFLAQSTIVICMGYDYEKWDPRRENGSERNYSLPSALDSFYAVVMSSLSSIIALTSQTRMRDTMRVLGHEARQLTAGLDALRVHYLLDPAAFGKLDYVKAQDVCRDISGYLKQLNFLFKGFSMLGSALPLPEKKLFWAYKELIFKWKDAYRTECETKNIRFYLEQACPNDEMRGQLYGDPVQLEQLLYNLVGNAIKYCYRGTKIYMDCSKIEIAARAPHILTVRDYGREIIRGEKPYEFYYRGDNAQQEDGLGIGLYIAKRIAVSHGGDIRHDCESISPYNIPLIEPYIKRDFVGKEQSLIPELKEELKMLQESGKLNAVLARNEDGSIKYSEPTDGELRAAIRQPTYEVTFLVTIPAKEDEK